MLENGSVSKKVPNFRKRSPGVRTQDSDSEKIILKVFDSKTSEEKRPHTCSVCAVYKREIAKGNREALTFYKDHISEIARRNNGVTVVLRGKTRRKMLTGSSDDPMSASAFK